MSGLDLEFVAQRLVSEAIEEALSTLVIPVADLIRVAMVSAPTSTAPAAEHTVEELQAHLDDADMYYDGVEATADGAIRDVMRVFVGPEWYFRRAGAPYSYADMRAIIEQLKTLSALYPRWLIVPGTIFYGLGYDTSGGAPNLATLQGEIVGCTRLTVNDADADALPVRAEPLNADTWFVINLAPAFYQGKVIHYVCKQYEQDLDRMRRTQDFWAMSMLPQATRRQVVRTPFFAVADVVGTTPLWFALEVCREHSMMRVVRAHAEVQPNDAGVDVHIIVSNEVQVRVHQTCTHDGGIVAHCDGHGPVTDVHHTRRRTNPCRDVALMAEAQRLAELDDGLNARYEFLDRPRREINGRVADLTNDLRAERRTVDQLKKRVADAEAEATVLSYFFGFLENAELPQWKSDLEFHQARVSVWQEALLALQRRAQQVATQVNALTDPVVNAMTLGRQQIVALDAQISTAETGTLTVDTTSSALLQDVRWTARIELQNITDPFITAFPPPNAVLAPPPAITYRCQSCDTAHQPFFANVCTNCGRGWFRDRRVMFYRSA